MDAITEHRKRRLRALIKTRYNDSQVELATAANLSEGRISQMLDKDQSFGEKAALSLAGKLGLPDRYFEDEFIQDAKPVMAIHPEEVLPKHLEMISEYRVTLAAGNGTIAYDEIEERPPKAYDTRWLADEGLNPKYLRRFTVAGDSMERTLFDGDTVLVNLQETEPRNDSVYAILVGNELRIKRIYTRIDGGLILHSDNPDWVPRQEELSQQRLQEHVRIIGRVRDKSGKGGL